MRCGRCSLSFMPDLFNSQIYVHPKNVLSLNARRIKLTWLNDNRFSWAEFAQSFFFPFIFLHLDFPECWKYISNNGHPQNRHQIPIFKGKPQMKFWQMENWNRKRFKFGWFRQIQNRLILFSTAGNQPDMNLVWFNVSQIYTIDENSTRPACG